MDLLVIGGTAFVGRAFVSGALARGWRVTTFNRGRSAPDVPGVEAVHGDREQPADLERLTAGRRWDAVVDTSGYVPRTVGASVRALDGHAGAYAFVSSISALPDWPAKVVDEDSPRHACAPDAGPGDGDYGVLKAGCERAVEEGFGGEVLVVEPGVIIGPYENIGRMPWWLRRTARGGPTAAPGAPGRPMCLIDARDIAAFTLDRLAAGGGGRYLTAGEPGGTTWGGLLETCRTLTGSDAEFVWLDDAFLVEQQVEPWSGLPLWLPEGPDTAAAWLPSSARARADGLHCRPVADSLRDTWAWLNGPDAPPVRPDGLTGTPPKGITPAAERALLARHREAAAS